MAAEQRKSGLGRARVRLAGGRGPPRERSAAVALATAAGPGKPQPAPVGPADLSPAAVSKPALQPPASGLGPLRGSHARAPCGRRAAPSLWLAGGAAADAAVHGEASTKMAL